MRVFVFDLLPYAEHLDHLLTSAGFVIDERYGDWDRSLMTPTSREIITVARIS